MLLFHCAVCDAANGLRELHTWLGEHPICSEACAQSAELVPHRTPAVHLHNALGALNGCEAALASAMNATHFAERLHHRMVQGLGAGMQMVALLGLGLGGTHTLQSGQADAVDRAEDMMAAEVVKLEQQLVPFYCQMMALHALGYPVSADLAPFDEELSLFHATDARSFDPGHALEQLQRTYAVLQAIYTKLSQTPRR